MQGKEGGGDLVRHSPEKVVGGAKMTLNYFSVISFFFFFSRKEKKNRVRTTYGAIPSHVGLASLLVLASTLLL